MLDISLEDLALYKTLKSRESSDVFARMAAGLLVPIAGDSREFLEFIRGSFPGFTRHNQQHSFTILKRIGMILSDRARQEMTSVEIFALIMAALFHDTGMIVDSPTLSADEARTQHHKRSREVIEKYFTLRLQIISEYTPRLKRVIGFVVESHNLTWEEMTSRADFSNIDSAWDQDLRANLLAILLRIGDLLDLDSDRTCDITRGLYPSFSAHPVSAEHHARHQQVERFHINSSTISISVSASTPLQRKLWEELFGYLKQDIEKGNTYVMIDSLKPFRLPTPQLQINDSGDTRS